MLRRRKKKHHKKWFTTEKKAEQKPIITTNYQTSYNKGYSASLGYQFKSCSHEVTPVFNLGNDDTKIEFCAATKDKIVTWPLPENTLILNVSGYSLAFSNVDTLKGPEEFNCLRELLPTPKFKELVVSWSDGQSFSGNVEFWQKFYDICQEKGYKKVIVCCLGGHGRTGTALAAILVANGAMDDFQAIDFIREHYCTEAIETKYQEKYLEELYFELHPEKEDERIALLTKEIKNDKMPDNAPEASIVIDMNTGETTIGQAGSNQRELVFPAKSNINSYENRNCVWCGQTFVAVKEDENDLGCSEECNESIKEFAGYDLRKGQ